MNLVARVLISLFAASLLPTIYALEIQGDEKSVTIRIGRDGATVMLGRHNSVIEIEGLALVDGEMAVLGDLIISPHGDSRRLETADASLREEIGEHMESLLVSLAPQIRQRMDERQMSEIAELSQALGIAAGDFNTIKSLIARIETLRKQKSIIDDPSNSIDGSSKSTLRCLNGHFNPRLLLGDMELDPTVSEIQQAAKALSALVNDKQASASELTGAMARLRKSRDNFSKVLANAQKDLRAVLTSPQEAALIVRGTLD